MASEGGNNGDDRGSTDHPAAARPAAAGPASAPKLRRIEITNYKAIDHLVLEIPAPVMASDADIFVVGSKNGVGKTSLLECCALGYLSRDLGNSTITGEDVRAAVRSGSTSFVIAMGYGPKGSSSLIGLASDEVSLFPPPGESIITDAIFGRTFNPLIQRGLFLFHSYRKVAEGSLRLQQMLKTSETRTSATLKLTILGMLMARSGLIEDYSAPAAGSQIEQLNRLLSTFAGGRVDKLRTVADDRLDIRITTSNGTSFSFDNLSSGQKEIISTLFLIWNDTALNPQSLVLIDEPELHLNAEWQREFIYQLHALAPQNQYILATHSEDIFASVSPARRVLLGPHG